ncbi:MAG: hypothetical protein DMG97_25185 [Acidobacteria bacterium]|nr:MAG: hypothetical protein DMG97_25185 [Acidobacteriota bacterium]
MGLCKLWPPEFAAYFRRRRRNCRLQWRNPPRKVQCFCWRRTRVGFVRQQVLDCGIGSGQVQLRSVYDTFSKALAAGNFYGLDGVMNGRAARSSLTPSRRASKVLSAWQFIRREKNYVVRSWLLFERCKGGTLAWVRNCCC